MTNKIEGTFINAKFKPRARLLLQLGDQLIKNESIALIELVKNAYDADANVVNVLMDIPDDNSNGTIIIEDDGYGMPIDIVENVWLEPGSDFKTKKIENNEVSPKYKRLPIGEKGIGRFGVHKLGNIIELVTKAENSKEVYVKIDWSTFNDYKYLEDVPIKIFERDTPLYFTNGKTGTQLTISNLHKTWERGVAREVKRAITTLISPFETKDSFKPEFDILNRPNWFDGLLKWEEVKELSLYHFKASMKGNEISSFKYEFTPWASMPKLELHEVGLDDKLVKSFKNLKYTNEKNKEIGFSLDDFSIGEIIFEGYIFDLDSYILSLGVSDKTGFRKYMKNAGGVSVFRDGLRVYDYGEPENDWLGLDYRRFNSPTKSISNNLILGAVFINRKDSKDLIEKTNREGFIENDAYKAFKNSILHIFDCVEILRISDKRKLKEIYGPTPKSAPVMSLLADAQVYVEKNVKDEGVKKEIVKFLDKIEADYKRVNENLLKAAGAGLSMSIVVHEVDKIIVEVMKVLTAEDASERVLKLVKHLSSLIDGYAEIVRKSNQNNENIIEVIDQALFNTEYRLAAHNISIIKEYKSYRGGTKVKIAKNLLIGSLMNVIDNSIYWLEKAKEAKPSLLKSIFINIVEEEHYLNLIFSDNGTGFLIPTDDIVEPFVSAKPNGIGLGLHISSEIMLAQKGKLLFPNVGDFELPNEFKNGATIVFALKKIINMSFPINGRIAIIDDNINQARPLMDVLSSKQYPFTYYSGELKYLPSKEDFCNDIRVVFLDINLIDNSEHDEKTLRSMLVPVLTRIISPKNYPFVIVYWSRHENHQKLIKDIFETDLKDRKPIGFLNESKLNYFNLDGSPSEELENSIDQLFGRIDVLLNENPVFSYLLHWENTVHISADNTVQELYSFTNSTKDWEHEANYVFNKLGKSYSGKYFDRSSPEEKINSSFQALNSVFLDTLEYETNSKPVDIPRLLIPEAANHDSIISINKKLLLSFDTSELQYSGIVIENNKKADKTEYSELINNLIFPNIKKHIYEREGIDPYMEIDLHKRKGLEKLVSIELKQFKEVLLEKQFRIILNVTPLCDFVQKKQKYDRLVKGLLIESKFKSSLDDKSEAIFISPDFLFNGLSYFLVLDFKYFFTDNVEENDDYKPIFRIRQQVLSEVQSKLARHVNRQGILFL